MQTGSAFILIGSFFGTVPSTETVPVTLPAVAVSTFWPAPAAAGALGAAEVLDVSCLLPPHATSEAASTTPNALIQTFRRRIEISSEKSCRTGHQRQLIIISQRETRPCRARGLALRCGRALAGASVAAVVVAGAPASRS